MRRLLTLSRELSTVRDEDAVIAWRLKLEAWWQAHGYLTKERSSDGYRYWFTHDRLRKAWQLLAKLSRDRTLFTYISYGNARTTSPLEGDINNGIRTVLRNHRGTSEAHMKRAAEWFLTLHEIPLERAHELIPSNTPNQEPERTDKTDKWAEPNYYDTHATAEEGLWARSGWAGRV